MAKFPRWYIYGKPKPPQGYPHFEAAVNSAFRDLDLNLSDFAADIWHAAVSNESGAQSMFFRLNNVKSQFDSMDDAYTLAATGRVTIRGPRARFWVLYFKGGVGCIIYDGFDFYIAPTQRTAVDMAENLTVREGNESLPVPKVVTRHYRLGPAFVKYRLDGDGSHVVVGQLLSNGGFIPMSFTNKYAGANNEQEAYTDNSLLDAASLPDICSGGTHDWEKNYREAASYLLTTLFDQGLYIPGFAPVKDRDGIVMGSRVDPKYDLGGLGGLAGRRRKKAPRAAYGSSRKWFDMPGGGRVSYGKLPQREFAVTLEYEIAGGGRSSVRRYAQSFRRDRGFFDVRLFDPHVSGGGWSESYFERSTRAKSHEEAVRRVIYARYARSDRYVEVVSIDPLDKRPSGVGSFR